MKLIKKVLIGIISLMIISSLGYSFFISNFQLFVRVPVSQIKAECDYEGLRKVIINELSGNAVTNRTVYISVSECMEIDFEDSELIFSASYSNLNQKDINFEWRSLDTLIIKYNKKLEVFKQKTESESVNPKIIIEYITK